MGIIRIFGKLVAFVTLGIGTILKLIGDFAVGVSGMLLHLIATILFVIAIVCRIFSVADWGAERRVDCSQLHRLYASHNSRWVDQLR